MAQVRSYCYAHFRREPKVTLIINPWLCGLCFGLPRALNLFWQVLSKLTDHTRIGKWAFPGGHLEYGESFIDCAERETLEETALKVKGLKIVHVTNDIFEEAGKHYITLFVACEMIDPQQEPRVSETDHCQFLYYTSVQVKLERDSRKVDGVHPMQGSVMKAVVMSFRNDCAFFYRPIQFMHCLAFQSSYHTQCKFEDSLAKSALANSIGFDRLWSQTSVKNGFGSLLLKSSE